MLPTTPGGPINSLGMPKMWQKWFDALQGAGVDRLGPVTPHSLGAAEPTMPTTATQPFQQPVTDRTFNPQFQTTAALGGLQGAGPRVVSGGLVDSRPGMGQSRLKVQTQRGGLFGGPIR